MEGLLHDIFEDREQAGRLLADKLLKYKDELGSYLLYLEEGFL
ncbi:hypothetical protein ABDJ41_19335 [Pedobacter sp. ASV1-7]